MTHTTTLPIIVLPYAHGKAGSPAIEQPVARWEAICAGQMGAEFVYIEFEATRDLSRWTGVARKRPYIVTMRRIGLRGAGSGLHYKVGAGATLDAALKIAKREAVRTDE